MPQTSIFTILTPIIYWLLIMSWFFIFIFYSKRLTKKKNNDRFLRTLLIILALDSLRTLLESSYFGVWFTSLSGIININYYNFLAQPHIVFFPKIINLIVSIAIIVIIIRRWLPAESQKIIDYEKTINNQNLILAQVPVSILITDLNGNIEYVNSNLCSLAGYNKDDLLGNNAKIFNSGCDSVTNYKELWDDLKNNKKWSGIFYNKKRNGDLYWESAIITPIYDTDGKKTNYLAIKEDISEKVKIENEKKIINKQLIESEKKFRRAIEEGPFPIMLHADDGEVLSISSTWTEITGYSHDDIPTIKDWTEKAHGIRKAKVTENINSLYALKNRKAEGEYEITCSDGTKRIWDFSSISLGRLEDNRQIAMSMAADITELKNIEIDLVTTKKRFESSIKCAPIPMVITDSNQDIILFNNKFTEIFGYTLDDVSSAEKWWETAYPDEIYRLELRKSWEVAISDALLSGNSIDMVEGNLTIKDRSVRRIEYYMTLLDGFSVIAMIDITKRIQDEKEKAILVEQLNHRNKMDSVGELAGGMAHDFNNVLTGILGASEILKFPGNGLNKLSLKYVDIIIQSSIRASDLIKKLLAFSRKGNILTTIIDIHKILNDTIDILKSTINKNINISLILNASNHNLLGDLSAIEGTLLNLLINASQAMPDGGTILIETSNIYINNKYCESSAFEINPGDFLQIKIKDTGFGILEKDLTKIFDPFFTTKDIGKGTGLGLSAVYGTIQNHHGVIEVFSEVGIGTTFEILIPCSNEIVKISNEESLSILGEGTILLVDDEEMIRTLTKDMLESLGYKVYLAEDGLASIDLFIKKYAEIDIVLMDMIMPKLNGTEAFYKMKEIDENCKVIISSGYTKDQNINKLLQDGLAGFINKPYKLPEISKVLSDVSKK